MTGHASLFWRLLPAVRRAERGRFLFFFALCLLLNAAQTIGLAGSEALFLGRLGASHLPTAFILASLTTVFASLVYAGLVGRTRNDRLLVSMLVGFSVVVGVGGLLLGRGGGWSLMALYCAFYVGQAVFINLHFWTFAADFFDTLASKRLFPLFSVASSLGGVLGGGVAIALCITLPAESLVVVWALGLALAGLLTQLGAASLRRWTPLDYSEADESSAESMRSALRFVRRSRFARGLVLGVVGMVFCLFILQYLYMEIFAAAFDSPEALAEFFGFYLAVSNAVELLVAHSITPWLIRRLGIAQANLVHSLLTLATFVVLLFDGRLWAGVLARVDRELLSDALANPIRTLTFNALPYRFRGRVRALVEGIVTFGAMSMAGALLLVVGTDVELHWLALAGLGSGLLYLVASLTVRREYLRSLVTELRAGRLNLQEVRSELGASEVKTLADRWETLVEPQGSGPTFEIAEIADILAEHGLREPLRRSVGHPDPRVRRSCLEALARHPDEALATVVAPALDDPERSVRIAAIRATGGMRPCPGSIHQRLVGLLGHKDPEIRAAAAHRLGDEGEATLREMSGDDCGDVAIAALDLLPATLVDRALARVGAEDPMVRGAALDCVTRIGSPASLPGEVVIGELEHAHPRVRAAAARALAARPNASSTRALARALDDIARSVRTEAARALAQHGEAGAEAASEALGSLRSWTAEAAISAVVEAGGPTAQALLSRAIRDRVHGAWRAVAALELLPRDDQSLPLRFLRATFESARARHCWVAFRILETSEDPAVVESIRKALEHGPARRRSDALELLCNLGDREVMQLFALLLEDGPAEETLPAIEASVALPSGFEDVLEKASHSPSRWVRMGATGCLAIRAGRTIEEEDTMESLLALRRVALFAGLSFDQLSAIKQRMVEAEYVTGEVVVREGDRGDDLFILLEGEARAYKHYDSDDSTYLTTFTPVSYFGEIAVLDSAPRSASVVVSRDARMLRLAGEHLEQLILQAPEISFEIFRVLTARLRAAEAR